MRREDRIEELFSEALARAPADRGSFLSEAGAGDPELRQQVESLLRAHERAGDFLQKTPGCLGQEDAERPVDLSEDAAMSAQPEAGIRRFGDHELLGEISRGGMGVVYKARQTRLNRLVALKMILDGQLASEAQVRRFHAEAVAAANLHHPNIVGIYEAGVSEGRHYLSMEYIQGHSLAQLEQEGNRRGREGKEAAPVMAKVARAVQYAHEQGILHRDLKPANVLIDSEGEPHILDFGLARRIGTDSSLTMEGAVIGTPSFMAPEQAAGKTKDLGPATDIYSLGAILYFLLTGRPPFAATSAWDTLVQVLEGEVIVPHVINPRVGRDLERICLRCLEKSPERRYPTAAALADDLERFVRDEPVQTRPPGLAPLLLDWMRSQPSLASRLIGLGACLIIAQLSYWLHPAVSLGQHSEIVGALGIWALLSGICQWVSSRGHWSVWGPYLWATADVVCLTAVLWLDGAFPGPLMGSFPVLVAASGLWFRTTAVGYTTMLAMLGYSFLVVDDYSRRHRWEQMNWHLAFLILLGLAGCAVAYQVHRIRALRRFYERRPTTD